MDSCTILFGTVRARIGLKIARINAGWANPKLQPLYSSAYLTRDFIPVDWTQRHGMSDTPITDAAEKACNCKHGCHVASWEMERIERELARYKAAVEKLCEGMAMPCGCARCELIREVQESLKP